MSLGLNISNTIAIIEASREAVESAIVDIVFQISNTNRPMTDQDLIRRNLPLITKISLLR
ncbi:MAG: hypothetical protein ACXACR_04805 [Candidatus Hodarchaeales archaeon]